MSLLLLLGGVGPTDAGRGPGIALIYDAAPQAILRDDAPKAIVSDMRTP